MSSLLKKQMSQAKTLKHCGKWQISPFLLPSAEMKSWLAAGILLGIMSAQLFIFILLQLFSLIPAEMRLMQSCCVRLCLHHFHTPKIFWTYWQISTHWSLKENQVPTSFVKITCSQRGWLQCEQALFQTEENPLVGKVFIYKHLSMGSISGKACSFFELKSIEFEALDFQQPDFKVLISTACGDTDL